MAEASIEVTLDAAGNASRGVAVLNGGGGGKRKKDTKSGGGSSVKEPQRCWPLGRSFIVLLICLLVVETTALIFLLVQKFSPGIIQLTEEEELVELFSSPPTESQDLGQQANGSDSPAWQPINGSGPPAWDLTNGSWPMLVQPRCFSMCESADLFYRQGFSLSEIFFI